MITSFEEIKQKLASRFKNEELNSLKHLPHPFELANLKEGATLIAQAIKQEKSILIVGDYDADGIFSTALMVLFFKQIGVKNFSYVIPNRFKDGYGISIPLIERYEADLIMTVDNGITATEVAQYCKINHQTLIITDHHTPKDTLPDALIINPQASGFIQKEICGCFVAWYLCAGIKQVLDLKLNLTPFLELVGIPTISDVMPLVSLNRIILKKALSLFSQPSFVFSNFLLQKYKNIDEETIGFFIAPLINASGRMGQTEIALNFILSSSFEEAQEYYEKLQALNIERKMIQANLQAQAQQFLLSSSDCVIAYGQDWHEGVLGVLCGKLMEAHQKPAFVLTLKEGYYQGSGRAPQGISLLKSLENLTHLCEFGGHHKALGIKIAQDNLQNFINSFISYSFEDENEHLSDFGEISPTLLNPEILEILKLYAPYGEGNPAPYFSLPPLPILEQKLIGKEKNHTQFLLQTPFNYPIKVVAFNKVLQDIDFANAKFYIKKDYGRFPALHLR